MRGRNERENTGVRVFGYETMIHDEDFNTSDGSASCVGGGGKQP